MTTAEVAVHRPPVVASRRRLRRGILNGAFALVVPVLLLTGWQLAADAKLVSPLLFPAPSRIWDAAVVLGANGKLWDHIGASVSLQGQGLLAGVLVGVVVGVLVGLFRSFEELVSPTLTIIQVVPGLALVPLLILLFGGEQGTRVLVVALGVFFPVYLNTVQGVRGTDVRLVEIGRVLGFSPTGIAWRILLPNALPLVFVGVRQSLKLAWVGVVGAELFIASSAGISFMMVEARALSQAPVVYLGLFLYAVLGVLSDLLVAGVEWSVLRWNRKAVSA